MKLAKGALLFTLAAASWAQVNVGEQKPEATQPFTMTTVATFKLPWRIEPVLFKLFDIRIAVIRKLNSPGALLAIAAAI